MEVVVLTRWRGRGRGAAIGVAAGLVAALATVVVAAPLGFPHVRSNLSRTAPRVSARPDLAVSPDGDRVVVAWTEEYRDGSGSKGHVYLRAASEGGGYWGSKITVFPGSDSACAYKAAVAVTGATAHVAYVVFNDSCGVPTQMQVRYKTCDLSGGTCDSEEQTVASVDTSFHRITWADLTLDTEGNPHVVWVRYDKDGKYGDIRYRARDGDSWGDREDVETSGNNGVPAIDWADGYAHVVWEEETEHRIWYRRRGTSGWDPSVSLCTKQTAFPPGNPDVAAGMSRVFVVWNWCSDGQDCEKYVMVYRRSNNRGSSWKSDAINDTFEVGTDLGISSWSSLEQYNSVGGDGGRDYFLQYLQPSIALNSDGWPAVVWHADRSGGAGTDYTIYYSHATSGSSTSVDWIIRTALDWGQPAVLGSAVVGVGEPEPGEQHLHIAYMQRPSTDVWEVYYDSNEPYADIRADSLVLKDSIVTLDGSGSYDPHDLPLTYTWSLVAKPAGSAAFLSGSSDESRTFTADVLGHYVITLEVDNGHATSPLATKTILACEVIYNVYLPLVMK
jgi:hypothetical protein